MSDEIAVIQPDAPLTEIQVRAKVSLIQRVMAHVMKNKTHYDVIPGCGKKKMLLKPGAEVLLCTFNASAEPMIDDLSFGDEIRYRVKVVLRSINTGAAIGYGVGECSSNEEKYKWRKAICAEEYEDTPEDRCRKKWSSYQGKTSSVNQVRTNPSDVANTVLKMGKKRALVDAALTTFAASDIFTQDGDPLPPNDPKTAEPKKSESVKATDKPKVEREAWAISEGQEKLIYARSKALGMEVDEIKGAFQVKHLYEIDKKSFPDIIKYFDSKQKEKEG